MAFVLFILVNATLFIRPAEIVPALLGWEIYFYVIVACFIAATPDILRYLTARSLDQQPITLFVFALLIAVLIPPTLMGDLAEAWRTGFTFAKIVVYYLLFVSIITTPDRLRILLVSILGFSAAITALVVLRYYDIIQLHTIQALDDTMAGQYGTTVVIKRLQGTGIFQDPNELCVMLSALVPLALYFVISSSNMLLRIFCASLVPLFGFAVFLTGSRGGFLAFAGGLAILSWVRYGWRKTALLGLVGAPLLLVLFAGRQTELSTSSGTGLSRVELWREWLTTFKENPLFGKGMSLPKDEEVKNRRSDQELKHLAHNSYLQSFADLGMVGGTLFVGAFFIALWSLYRVEARGGLFARPVLNDLQPFLLAALGTYALGMMSLSICYVVPTYLMLALTVSYTRIVSRSPLLAPPPLRLDATLMGRCALASVSVLACIYLFVRFLA
jgi:putative inorganic carbon (hco3(-)) transporter